MEGAEGTEVVNAAHLMQYVDEQREEGNAAFKAGRTSEALAAWQRALDAIAQCEGRPMLAGASCSFEVRARSAVVLTEELLVVDEVASTETTPAPKTALAVLLLTAFSAYR